MRIEVQVCLLAYMLYTSAFQTRGLCVQYVRTVRSVPPMLLADLKRYMTHEPTATTLGAEATKCGATHQEPSDSV